MNDTIQTLLRSVFKFGSAALVTHGVMNADQVNQAATLFLGLPTAYQIGLGLLIAAGSVLWGIVHRTPAAVPGSSQAAAVPISIRSVPVMCLAALLVLVFAITGQARTSIATPQTVTVGLGKAPNQAVGTLYATNVVTSNLTVTGTTTYNQSGTNLAVSALTASSVNASTVSAGTLSVTNVVPVIYFETGSNGNHLPDLPPQYVIVSGYPYQVLYLPKINGRKMTITVHVVTPGGSGLYINADTGGLPQDAIVPSTYAQNKVNANSTTTFVTDGSGTWWAF